MKTTFISPLILSCFVYFSCATVEAATFNISSAKKLIVKNKTSKKVFVSIGKTVSGGTDGLGSGDLGSWGCKKSIGWYSIEPFTERTLEIDGYIKVYMYATYGTAASDSITRSGKNEFGVESEEFYIHPKDGFDYEVFTYDNTKKRRVESSKKFVQDKGGKSVKFEAIIKSNSDIYDTYTINP